MTVPKRTEMRDDVKAAAEQERVATANANISLDRDRPTLDVFGSLALNGKDTSFTTSAAQSASFVHPTTTIGLRFSAPLDLGVLSRAHQGWNQERSAAELNYQRKFFEQERSWQDLSERLNESKRRLGLARELEVIQQSKMENERQRLKNGRSTTFQVLSFEQDYFAAELSRLRAQSEVLGILSQMKLFGVEL